MLKTTHRADLARIIGVGMVCADLQEYGGVDPVSEPRNRKPQKLYDTVAEVAHQQSVKRIPHRGEVQSWVEEAKQLEHKVDYPTAARW